ncbi:MAG: hypothetical protein SNJ62_04705 [Chloracidobacterium sp.]
MPCAKTFLAMLLGFGLSFFPGASHPSAAGPVQGNMLCTGTEKLIFGATTTSGKMVCLCASADFTNKKGYLQYRFGRPGRVELEYPADQSVGSQRLFYYAHYTRYQREWASVRFKNKEYNYRIYYSYDGEAGRPTAEYGLNVYLGEGDKGTNFTLRRNSVVGALQELEGAIQCDREDALADCP